MPLRVGVNAVGAKHLAIVALEQKRCRDVDNRDIERRREFEQTQVVHLVPLRDILDTSIEPAQYVLSPVLCDVSR